MREGRARGSIPAADGAKRVAWAGNDRRGTVQEAARLRAAAGRTDGVLAGAFEGAFGAAFAAGFALVFATAFAVVFAAGLAVVFGAVFAAVLGVVPAAFFGAVLGTAIAGFSTGCTARCGRGLRRLSASRMSRP